MWKGIEQVKPGNTLGDIGYAIQNYAEKKGYSIVRDFCGHGIGKVFHDNPSMLHYGNKGEGTILKRRYVFYNRTYDKYWKLQKEMKYLTMDGLQLREINHYLHNLNIPLPLLHQATKYLLYLQKT